MTAMKLDQKKLLTLKSLQSNDVSKIHLDDEESFSRSTENALYEPLGLWFEEKGKPASLFLRHNRIFKCRIL